MSDDPNPVVVDMTPAEARWVAGLLRDVAADFAPYAERAFLRFAAVLDSAREVERGGWVHPAYDQRLRHILSDEERATLEARAPKDPTYVDGCVPVYREVQP